MATFFKENWIWIATPIVLVLVFFAAILLTQGGADSPFVYNIF